VALRLVPDISYLNVFLPAQATGNPSKSSQSLAQKQIKSSHSSQDMLSYGIRCHKRLWTVEFYIGPKATGLIQRKVH